MKDFSSVKRWVELSWDEKKEYYRKVNILFTFLDSNKGKKLSWDQVNNTLGLEHLYRFSIDDRDDVLFDDDGIWIE